MIYTKKRSSLQVFYLKFQIDQPALIQWGRVLVYKTGIEFELQTFRDGDKTLAKFKGSLKALDQALQTWVGWLRIVCGPIPRE